jgi:hypothetical protein
VKWFWLSFGKTDIDWANIGSTVSQVIRLYAVIPVIKVLLLTIPTAGEFIAPNFNSGLLGYRRTPVVGLT